MWRRLFGATIFRRLFALLVVAASVRGGQVGIGGHLP
jgi:hypothetical protein